MKALPIFGAVAEGYNAGQDKAINRRKAELDMEVTQRQINKEDYLMQKQKEQDRYDNTFMPMGSFATEHPEQFKQMQEIVGKEGIGEGIKIVDNQLYATPKSMKAYQSWMNSNVQNTTLGIQAMSNDIRFKMGKISSLLSSGVNTDGSKIKDDQIQKYQEEMKKLQGLEANFLTAEQNINMIKAKADMIKATTEKATKAKPFGTLNGQPVSHIEEDDTYWINGKQIQPNSRIVPYSNAPNTTVHISTPQPTEPSKLRSEYNAMSAGEKQELKNKGISNATEYIEWYKQTGKTKKKSGEVNLVTGE